MLSSKHIHVYIIETDSNMEKQHNCEAGPNPKPGSPSLNGSSAAAVTPTEELSRHADGAVTEQNIQSGSKSPKEDNVGKDNVGEDNVGEDNVGEAATQTPLKERDIKKKESATRYISTEGTVAGNGNSSSIEDGSTYEIIGTNIQTTSEAGAEQTSTEGGLASVGASATEEHGAVVESCVSPRPKYIATQGAEDSDEDQMMGGDSSATDDYDYDTNDQANVCMSWLPECARDAGHRIGTFPAGFPRYDLTAGGIAVINSSERIPQRLGEMMPAPFLHESLNHAQVNMMFQHQLNLQSAFGNPVPFFRQAMGTQSESPMLEQHLSQGSMNIAANVPLAVTLPKLVETKNTTGRTKIKIEYIVNKPKRYTTFSKRKSGIMKKASLNT